MMPKPGLKTIFWNYVMAGEENPDAAFSPYEALDLVEEFVAAMADDEIEQLDSDRELGPLNNDLVAYEERVYEAIGLHVTYVPEEDSGMSRTASWA